jgi:AcrR family transcriptional regulator
MGRRYTLARRAALVEDTRRRIVQAAMDLHGTRGPAHTTISAVAERAGVQRLTVYRHFPDEAALFRACSSQWIADHPPPAIVPWTIEAQPEVRLRGALGDLYGYFARTSQMWERVYRDGALVPALRAPMAAWEQYLEAARDALVGGWRVDGTARRRLAIAIAHALAFTTWASLARLGCDTRTAAGLMADMVFGVAGRAPASGRRPHAGRSGRRTRSI